MNSKKERLLKPIMTVVAVLLLTLLLIPHAYTQSISDSALPQMDRMRVLEVEIAQLETQLAMAMKKQEENLNKLKEIDIKINECYMKMDQTEEDLAKVKKSLNKKLRQLYIQGRKDTLIDVLCCNNVTDFIVNVDRMVNMTSEQSGIIAQLKEKRGELEKSQNRLIDYKDYYTKLSKSSDINQIETQLEQKRSELSTVTGNMIQNELPSTLSPQSNEFNPGTVYQQPDENGFVGTGQVFSGYSSWYGNEFHGRPTASGEVFDQYALTCAHRTLPFGTWLKVTFKGRSVYCRVNDRGPFITGRILDLSRGSAEAIGLSGVQWVDCEIVVPK